MWLDFIGILATLVVKSWNLEDIFISKNFTLNPIVLVKGTASDLARWKDLDSFQQLKQVFHLSLVFYFCPSLAYQAYFYIKFCKNDKSSQSQANTAWNVKKIKSDIALGNI